MYFCSVHHYYSNLIRNVLVLFKEHLELADADTKVTVCKLVWNVEAQCAVLASFQHHSMEQAQRLPTYGTHTVINY